MRAKGINQMSTRRVVRPDAMVYRQTRKMYRRRKTPLWPAIFLIVVVLLVVLIVVWVIHKH
jgi:cell division septal protein FtsQ